MTKTIQKLELEPTKENLFSTIAEDLIGRNESVWYLANLCDVQEGKCSIAIDGKWGSGKTFFIKHIQMLIEAANPFTSKYSKDEKIQIQEAFRKYHDNTKELSEYFSNQVCVYYDAWANDNDIDPILSLVYSIVMEAGNSFHFEGDTDIPRLACLIFDFFKGRNTTEILDFLHSEKPLSAIQKQKDIYDLVSDFLDSLLEERGNRLIIFIDELDRCKPSYAVQFLERIKHYFNNDRITFVFAINMQELQHTIRCFYGDGFNACKYLDRFFDYRIALPEINLTRYLQEIGLDNGSYYFDTMCRKVIYFYGFSLREIVKYYRLTKMAAYKPIHSGNYSDFPEDHGKLLELCLIVPVIIGLSMTDTVLYRDFIEGKNANPLIDIVGSGDGLIKLCSYLLSSRETFDENPRDGYTTVSLSEKLREVYQTLFVDDPLNTYGEQTVGTCYFRKQDKTALLKVTSILSKYSDYS